MPSVAPPHAKAHLEGHLPRRRALIPAIIGLLSALVLGGGAGCFNAGVATPADNTPLNALNTADGDGTTGPTTPVASPPSSAPSETTSAGDTNTPLPPTQSPNVTPGNGNAVNGNAVNGTMPSQPVALTGPSRFTRVGRFALADNGNQVTFRVQGARIGATFSGTSVTALLTDTGSDGLDVYVDGGSGQVVQLDVMTTPTPVVLAQNLQAGMHTVWIVKRTEGLQRASDGSIACGAITLWDMTADSGSAFYTPPPGQKRRIEAIGDSSSAGYGVDVVCGDTPSNGCSIPKNQYSPRVQDVAKSIPGVVGQLLSADVSNISYSGQGVIYSYYDAANCNTTINLRGHCLPTLWQQAVPPAATPTWDFSQQVDVVILSAGGDDLDNQGRFPAGSDAFSQGFASWLGDIRARYPKAFIIAVMSPAAANGDIATLGGALQKGVALAQAAQPGGQDTNMAYFNYFDGTPYKTYSDIAQQLKFYYGSYGHCSAAGSAWLGDRLAKVIAAHMGW